jgi:hypothetical protein
MKYTASQVPPNAFIRISVNHSLRKVYFKDLKMYTKITRKTYPPAPHYSSVRAGKHAEINTDEENSEESCCKGTCDGQ